MKAIELLELLQQDAYRNKGVDPRIVQEQEIKYFFEFIENKKYSSSERENKRIKKIAIKQMKQSLRELPTIYQSVQSHSMLKEIFNNLDMVVKNTYFGAPSKKDWDKSELSDFQKFLYEFDKEMLEDSEGNAVKKESLQWKPLPLFGSIDFGYGFTAYVVQSNEPLIIVSDELFPLASVVSSIISECYPCILEKGKPIGVSTNREEWIALLNDEQRNDVIVKRFCDLVFALLLNQSPGAVKPEGVYQYGTYQGIISIYFTNIIETFIASHEYCHYWLDHPPYKISSLDQFLPAEYDGFKLGLKEMLRNFNYEWEADLYGLIITFVSTMLDRENQLDSRFTIAALFTALWTLEILDRVSNLREGKPTREERFGATHPSPKQRMSRFKKDFMDSDIVYEGCGLKDIKNNDDIVKKRKAEIQEILTSQIDNIDFAFEFLWNKFERFLSDTFLANQRITIKDIVEMDHSVIQGKIYGSK